MEDRNEIPPALTSTQVARILNIHVNTVRRWNSQGLLKAYRVGPRADRRFKWEDVVVILQEETERHLGNGSKLVPTGRYSPKTNV